MTPEAQIIAIAEVCGLDVSICPTHRMRPPCCDRKRLSDYLSDLNAMHEAEKVLTDFQLRKYGEHLQDIVNFYCVGVVEDYPRHLMCLAKIAGATAAQRAEAFLKTLNLWVT